MVANERCVAGVAGRSALGPRPGRAAANAAGPGRRRPARRPRRERLPGSEYAPRSRRRCVSGGRDLGCRGRRLAPGHRNDAAARRARGGPRRVHRPAGRVGALDRLPRQPVGRDRARRQGHADHQRRARPRVPDRRRPAVTWNGPGDTPQRSGEPSRQRWALAAIAGRWCWSSRSIRSSATPRRSRSSRRPVPAMTHCWWSTRRTASASGATRTRVVAGSCTSSGWPPTPTWSSPARCPSRWAAREAPYSGLRGWSTSWSTGPDRSSSTPASRRPRPVRRWPRWR